MQWCIQILERLDQFLPVSFMESKHFDGVGDDLSWTADPISGFRKTGSGNVDVFDNSSSIEHQHSERFDQLWALLSMRVQLADSDQCHAQSAAVRFGGLGRRYILVVFDDRPEGLLSHADGSGLLPEARPKLTGLSWDEIRLALMLDIGCN